MPLRQILCLLVVFGVGGRVAAAPAQQPGFDLITRFFSSDIGTDAQSFCAIQAPSGALLVGGNSLLTFDGERWDTTPIAETYGLRGLDFGPDGKLWVAAAGELGWFEPGQHSNWQFTSLRSQLPVLETPLGQVWRVFVQADGRVVFVTANRVLRWDGRAFELWEMPGERRLHACRVDGTVYVHWTGQGLYEMTALGPELFIPQSSLGDDVGVLWLERRASDWLLGTSDGLLLYREGKMLPFGAVVSQLVRRDLLTAVARLANGDYALGTHRGGIVLMRPEGSLDRVLTEADGLPTLAINALFSDREGLLWAATPSSIFHVNLVSATTVFDERAGLPIQSYRSIGSMDGTIVVGSERGLYELSADGRSFEWSPSVREQLYDFRQIGSDFWVSSFRGARVFSGGVVVGSYASRSDVFSVSGSKRSPDEVYLFDNRDVVSFRRDGEKRIAVRTVPDIVRSMAEDEEGNLWLGTVARGVFLARIDPSKAVEATPVPHSYGLPTLRGRSFVCATNEGALLLFAENGGWIKQRGAARFDAIQNYPVRGVTAVSAPGSDNAVWIVHSSTATLAPSVARISSDMNGARWEPHSVPSLAVIGLPRSIFVERIAGNQTAVWVGGSKAVLRNVVSGSLSAPVPRPPLLRAFVSDEQGGNRQSIVGPLSYLTRSVEFSFAVAEFARRDSLRLQTFIEGIDQDWVAARPDSRRELSALRDGKYVFKVRTVAETGIASAPTVLPFEVLPPVWRTPRFVFGLAFGMIPIGYGAYLLRVRSLRRRTAQLERKVRERTEELEAANAAKTQFVANMSHDIRNPLNGIVGLALALEDSRLDSRQREIVATLRECTTYLSSLVDDVLDFASIEAGRVELRPGAFAPQELLRSIVATLRTDAAQSGATMTIAAAADLPPNIVGDAGRIQQILINFVSNALKYAGGQIQLSAATPVDSPGEVEFAVRDEGPGISAAEQATLFTKFTRLKTTRGGEHIPGTGLGLAACRLLADIMGGSVGVDSRPGEGARFFLRLPLAIADAPVASTTASLPNTTVLLVEDTDYNAWAASAVLAKLGLTCDRARTGSEALQLFGAKRYNVVLLDRNLPDMDGTEVAKRIRAVETERADGQRSLLLAVTAYCTADDKALCLQAGMDAFVGKPLTPDKLRKILLEAARQMLGAASLHAPAAVTTPPPKPTDQPNLEMLSLISEQTAAGLAKELGRFLAVLQDAESDLIAAVQADRFNDVAKIAHNLRSQAGMVGGSALSHAAWELESDAGVGDTPACRASLQRVREEIRVLTAAMRRRQHDEQTA